MDDNNSKKKNKKKYDIQLIFINIIVFLITICILLYLYKNRLIKIFDNNNNNIDLEITTKDSISCQDNGRKLDCINWKQYGYCELNPGYMIQYCASTCEMCHLVNPQIRCKQFHQNPTIFKNDEMNNMFNNLEKQLIINNNNCNNNTSENNQKEEDICIVNNKTINIISRDPWIVTIDNFITSEEADTIISIPHSNAWIQSTAAGAYQADGIIKREISEVRTSRNAWCQVGCDDHPIVQNVLKRMSNTVNVPISNFEHMQILRYEEGQFYRGHHDYIHSPPYIEASIGPRIMTFFLYLSDVELGGETYFTTLNITISPVKGKALIWVNTMSNNPSMKDIRTHHEAKDVIKGIKYGANIWIHQKDFRSASHWACSG